MTAVVYITNRDWYGDIEVLGFDLFLVDYMIEYPFMQLGLLTD